MAGGLTGAIFIINVALHKPVLDALLFSPAIAVGIRPQLARRWFRPARPQGRGRCPEQVLVKRVVSIEDLGDLEVLYADRSGSLPGGGQRIIRSTGPDATPARCWPGHHFQTAPCPGDVRWA